MSRALLILSSLVLQWHFFMIQVFVWIQMCPRLFRNWSQSLKMSQWEIRQCQLQRWGRSCVPRQKKEDRLVVGLENSLLLIAPLFEIISCGTQILVVECIGLISSHCHRKYYNHHIYPLKKSCWLWGCGGGHMHWQMIPQPLQILIGRRYLFDVH